VAELGVVRRSRAATDFLYPRDEYRSPSKPTERSRRLDLAGRATKRKNLCQNRMLEHAAELYAWLEAGAHFYVCGDASRMAKDVDAACISRGETRAGNRPTKPPTYTTLKAARDMHAMY